MLGIYVHVPFCASKCGYCDFHSIVADGTCVGNYIKAFQKEVEYYSRRYQSCTFDTLFFGGGTPTVLQAAELGQMIDAVINNFNFKQDFEFTIEANPCTLQSDKVERLAFLGVNRISLGAQAFQDDILKQLERQHSVADIYTSVEYLKKAGINNINLDLMYGLPGQTVQAWEESLALAIALQPTHLSCYSLIIEEETPFYQLFHQDKLNLPSEEQEFQMFQVVQQRLKDAGYQHYEISNYALKQEYQAQHNLIYWHNQSYLGLGSGAHGYLERRRYFNTLDLDQYTTSWLAGTPAIAECELVSDEQAMDETMMLGLRLLQGVEEASFEKRFGVQIEQVYHEQLQDLMERKLLVREQGCLKLTKIGLPLGNLVFSAFIR